LNGFVVLHQNLKSHGGLNHGETIEKNICEHGLKIESQFC
jgi:hypothetical protein